MDLLNNWGTDDTNIPKIHYNSLCYFDYQRDYQKAINYRMAEKPFIVYNIPVVNDLVSRWSDLDYLKSIIGNGWYRSETSKDNHFMYWSHVSGAAYKYKDRNGNPWKVNILYLFF